MQMVLEGIRVLDWSVYQAGPYAGAMLGDLGAEVIHIEERTGGDLLRGVQTTYGASSILPGGLNAHFEEHNRNKRSITLNLKKPEGKKIAYRLVEKSDVFLTNFRLGVVKRLGLDYETLSRINPKLIYASASGFGRRGPDNQVPSLDMIAQARSGSLLSLVSEDGEPTLGIPNAADRACSFLLAYGILAALIARDRTRIGQELHVSQLAAMINLQGYMLMLPLMFGKEFPGYSRSTATNPMYNVYKCRDKKWIAVGGLLVDLWPKFCDALGREDLKNAPMFADAELRSKNRVELIQLLDQIFATKSRDEWLKEFMKVDFIVSPVNRLRDLTSDPQVQANNYIIECEHPTLGSIKYPGFPVEFSKTPMNIRMTAPELGQHTEEILVDICGYTWDDITAFKDGEVI